MYTLAKQFDANDVPKEGNDNWLSDAKNTAPRRKDQSTLKENNNRQEKFTQKTQDQAFIGPQPDSSGIPGPFYG
jgi:hypothetical protein